MPVAFLLLVLLAIALIARGLNMIRRGRQPRRVGEEPHCRACDYLLIGLASDRCPECGASLTEDNIVHGQRLDQPRLVWTGGALLLLGLVFASPLVVSGWRSLDWYHFKPAFLLVRELKSSSSPRAWNEVLRRDRSGSLDVKTAQQIIDIALAEQGAAVHRPMARQLLDFAGRQYLAGHMTDAQTKLFGHQSIRFKLQVREQVADGNLVPFVISSNSATPSSQWWAQSSYHDVAVDGNPIPGGGPGSGGSMSGLGVSTTGGSTIEYRTLGQHRMDIIAKIELYTGPFGNMKASQLVHQEDIPLSAVFEVEEPSTTGPVRGP